MFSCGLTTQEGCIQFICPFPVILPVFSYFSFPVFNSSLLLEKASCCILCMQQNAFINMLYQCTAA